jgi:hypothetical protein
VPLSGRLVLRASWSRTGGLDDAVRFSIETNGLPVMVLWNEESFVCLDGDRGAQTLGASGLKLGKRTGERSERNKMEGISSFE